MTAGDENTVTVNCIETFEVKIFICNDVKILVDSS